MTIIHSGTAQAGASKSITLAPGASEIADAYKFYVAKITGGTGVGQVRNVVGSGKNRVFPSESFDTYWSKEEVVITANDALSPDGTLTADKCVATAVYAQHRQVRGGAIMNCIAGLPVTLSVHVKQTSADNHIYLWIWKSGDARNISFNLTSGTRISGAVDGYEIQAKGAGWWRVSLTHVPASNSAYSFMIYETNATGSASITGDGINGTWRWGAQVEYADAMSDYIPTVLAPAVGAIIDTPWDIIPDATSTYEIHEYLIAAMTFAATRRRAEMAFSSRSASFAMTKRSATFRKVP